jgi:hypothetical protein
MPSRALLTEVQTIPNADIVQALANLKITATSGITTTLPATASTLAGLSLTQSFTAANTFSLITDATSSTVGGAVTISGGLAVAKKAFIGTLLDLVASTATAGQITQAGNRLFHTFGGTGNIWLGLTTGNTAGALTGTNNIAIGTQSGKSMTSGANNMLIGVQCGEFITSGFNNCCVGASSGYNIGAGTYNTAIGYVALQFGGSGGYNTAIGQASLQNITSGTLNTCIGSDAGDVDGVVVGGLTGKNITSGGNNTIIGAGAGTTLATGTYRTAIGSDSRCNVNNAIKLGRDHTSTVAGDMVMLPSVLTANLPIATAAMAGAIIYVSDDGTGHVNFCNGSSWARIN